MSLLRCLGALCCALAACARPPPLVAAPAPTLHLEILDAETGVRRLTVSGLPADDPLATLAGPFGLLVQPRGGGRPLYVELSAEVRGERLWVHSVVTRLDDEGTLPAVFELRSKERGLAVCALGPCPAGLTRASIDAAESILPRVHSLAGVPLTGPLEWRASTPDGEALALRAFVR